MCERKDLSVYYSAAAAGLREPADDLLRYEELVRIAKSRAFLRYIFRYRNVTLYAPELYAFPRPFLTALICRLMARGHCAWVDQNGNSEAIGPARLYREWLTLCREQMTYKKALRNIEERIDALMSPAVLAPPVKTDLPPVYLRTDLAYGYVAGGSIGHIAGVVNNFDTCGLPKPIFISSDVIATIRPDIETFLVREPIAYRNVRDIAGMMHNDAFFEASKRVLGDRRISMVYQRSALNSYAGVLLADAYRVPYVLEYNGSEVWAARHWGGRKLKAVSLSEKIERLTFSRAQLIVCVSRPLKDELMTRGVPEEKILVNPNGVDADAYTPEIDGAPVRERYGIPQNALVVGFIGTFGAWHGAEILAEAFTRLGPHQTGAPVFLLLIGDGPRMPKVKQILRKAEVTARCVCTGMIPQALGAGYLAACDVLVSPQVRNPDGTPFFGSPTKMFEYMAVGKGIVASNLDQMGEILTDGETALLCEPGNVEELRRGIESLLSNASLRSRLGQAARQEVCARHTWERHTRKIIDNLPMCPQ